MQIPFELGLIAASLGQFTLHSTRLGLYETVDRLNWTRFGESESHSTLLCIFWGSVTGTAGACISCPFFMVKTQLQAQSHGKYTVGYQHGHVGTVNAFANIYGKHGLRGFYHGYEAFFLRITIVSGIQMTVFNLCKDFIQKYQVKLVLIEFHSFF